MSQQVEHSEPVCRWTSATNPIQNLVKFPLQIIHTLCILHHYQWCTHHLQTTSSSPLNIVQNQPRDTWVMEQWEVRLIIAHGSMPSAKQVVTSKLTWEHEPNNDHEPGYCAACHSGSCKKIICAWRSSLLPSPSTLPKGPPRQEMHQESWFRIQATDLPLFRVLRFSTFRGFKILSGYGKISLNSKIYFKFFTVSHICRQSCLQTIGVPFIFIFKV